MLGGLLLAAIPGVPHVEFDPDLVLLVFLPPLLFVAAIERRYVSYATNRVPVIRLAFGLMLFTMVVVAIVAYASIPSLGWAAAFTLGAIVSPTDAIAATSVFRRLGVPRLS